MTRTAPDTLERRLRSAVRGEILFDRASRGRYATDASHYQMMPRGVVIPRDVEDLTAILEIAREAAISVVARGGGTSQCGQTVNSGLVLDLSKYMNKIIEIDAARQRCRVQPGVVLDQLNQVLRGCGLWFPVDVSTASRATIGGMTGNNSCGMRSIRYGTMRDNTLAIDALMADGRRRRFAETAPNGVAAGDRALFDRLFDLGAREAAEIRDRFPGVMRRVGGYNIDALVPNGAPNNLAHLLVGSEGTLALSTEIELKLAPVLHQRTIGVCHFARFRDAMAASQHLVRLDPVSVELIDATMIGLARDIPLFRAMMREFVRGEPAAVLVVEFAEEDQVENRRRLGLLTELIGDLGFAWSNSGATWGGVVPIEDPRIQAGITEVRQSGLNIMMSMKEAGKPISFVEDCAVPLEHLADYTDGLTQIFERHGTRGTWYAHASVGCLHVRPVLNLKLDKDVKAMRAIAEEAFELVRRYNGSHSGEHGDGIVRSEFHAAMFGPRMVAAFESVKDLFDPNGLLNPGKIVRAPRMDDTRLFRYGPDYREAPVTTALEWPRWPGGGGFQRSVEMCNNNGQCRKLAGGVMCPSFRVTRDERDSTRGRANTLRLALSGQIGPDPLTSDDMYESLKLCVSCKGCRRECPTGVDMAKMKIEVLAARAAKGQISARDRLIAYLPRYAPVAARLPWLANLRDRIPGARRLSERLLGFTARRPLPAWSPAPFTPSSEVEGRDNGREVILFADCFNRYFEPENLRAGVAVLAAAGTRIHHAQPQPEDGARPLCCGRTFLSAGLVDQAREEARRLLAALAPAAERGVPIVGLEPSCLFTLRDELPALLPGTAADAVARQSAMFEEHLNRESDGVALPLRPLPGRVYLHGHCHQKAFGAMSAVESVLRWIPGLALKTLDTSCCGMAGAFGYQAETYETSMAMAEASVLPPVRHAEADAVIVADGTSCRHQIQHGTGRTAVHVARVLERALAGNMT